MSITSRGFCEQDTISICSFSCVQEHAADTYAEFAEQNREALQSIPPPLVALNYYKVRAKGRGLATYCTAGALPRHADFLDL